MGEAKRRRQALAWGQPLERDLHRCPRCQGHRTAVSDGPPMALSKVATSYGLCLDCKCFWEAYPASWKHDVCEGEPCDNCAFRPGAPEHEDSAEWRSMLAKLKHGQEFRCHKGAPIIIDAEAGTAEFDAEWVNRRGRMCAGFHRAIMTKPGWLEARYQTSHVLTSHDAEKAGW
jgi:hypothetical protein